MVSKIKIQQFNASRRVKDTSHLCYAPLLTLNFDQTGNVTACCFNRSHVLGTYPENNLKEIWEGRQAELLRAAMIEQRLDLGCRICERIIEDGNYESVLIRHFDNFFHFLKEKPLDSASWFNKPKGSKLPAASVFEFEISNTCNLECIMCGGKWSSAIRKNREKLAAIQTPYDNEFVKQVKEFLPELKRANFLGGEPFLISLYYEIWEAIIAINPAIDVAITSNGTILSERAKRIIEKLPRCSIVLSIDSLQKKTWESIRVNGQFEVLKQNIDYLLTTGKLASFSVCPMIQNRYEIPDIVSYCIANNLDVHFNVVYNPLGEKIKGIHQSDGEEGLIPETTLRVLPVDKLSELIGYYKSFSFSGRYKKQFDNLIVQLESWLTSKQIIDSASVS